MSFCSGSPGILPGSLTGWWCLLFTCWAATYCSRVYRTRSHFREDSCRVLRAVWNLLSYSSSLDWSLVCTVLHHHCRSRWISYCQVRTFSKHQFSPHLKLFRYFTRFTEEAFAALVGLIFIVESLKKIFSKYKRNFYYLISIRMSVVYLNK